MTDPTKRRSYNISMSSMEWSLCIEGAEAWSRLHGPRSTGHRVSTSAFIREAALAKAEETLATEKEKSSDETV